ncbi:Bromodomain-containing protein [Mycena galopus ATCC 62051]|nr:Bromodomain-containing protein [Mycena galopus ATCC 62051]
MAAPGLDATRWLFCYSCIQTLQNHKDAGAFLAPVDPVALGIPDYLSIIAQPMDLSTVRQKLASADPAKSSNPRPPYSIIDFVSDVHLIFRNCDVYNGAAHPVSKQGQRVKRKFDQIMEKLPALVILQTPLPVAGPASNTVDHVSQTFRTARAGRRTRSLSPPAGPTSKRIRMDLAPPTSSSDRAGSHKQASSSTTAVHPRPPPHGRSALTLSTQPSSPSASRPQQHLGPIPLARQPLGTKPAASALNTVARQPRGTKRATSPSNTIDSPAKRLAGARGRLTENAIPAK